MIKISDEKISNYLRIFNNPLLRSRLPRETQSAMFAVIAAYANEAVDILNKYIAEEEEIEDIEYLKKSLK